ncbi:hypothetical protein FACS18949_07390 [Clostridia bacterium]|nr:hypothetical protein FACS18949_07390 [Clostridia bacterium]
MSKSVVVAIKSSTASTVRNVLTIIEANDSAPCGYGRNIKLLSPPNSENGNASAILPRSGLHGVPASGIKIAGYSANGSNPKTFPRGNDTTTATYASVTRIFALG